MDYIRDSLVSYPHDLLRYANVHITLILASVIGHQLWKRSRPERVIVQETSRRIRNQTRTLIKRHNKSGHEGRFKDCETCTTIPSHHQPLQVSVAAE